MPIKVKIAIQSVSFSAVIQPLKTYMTRAKWDVLWRKSTGIVPNSKIHLNLSFLYKYISTYKYLLTVKERFINTIV